MKSIPARKYPLTPNVTQSKPNSAKAIWDFEGIYCTSRHLPHVKFAGLIHPGILGCAPSAEVCLLPASLIFVYSGAC